MVKMSKFGSAIGMPTKEEQLKEAAKIHIRLGNVQRYCELMVELGEVRIYVCFTEVRKVRKLGNLPQNLSLCCLLFLINTVLPKSHFTSMCNTLLCCESAVVECDTTPFTACHLSASLLFKVVCIQK